MASPRDEHLTTWPVAAGTTAWVVTDGKIGDRVQCLGVAEALGLKAEERVIGPRAPWSWLAPYGPPDPRDRLSPPYPNIAIASGRRAAPVLRFLKHASHGAVFTVFLKMPTSGHRAADVIWVPAHDPLRGDNVVVTLTSPSLLTPDKLREARHAPDPRVARLPAPRVGLILGGPGGGYCFNRETEAQMLAVVGRLLQDGYSVAATPSRRTPPGLTAALAALCHQRVAAGRLFVWDGEGDNPYVSILACADALVVTADSANMLGEATLTGAPVHVVEPPGGRAKLRGFVDRLVDHGAARRWCGHIEHFRYAPLDATPTIAEAVAVRYAAFRRKG